MIQRSTTGFSGILFLPENVATGDCSKLAWEGNTGWEVNSFLHSISVI